MSILSKNLGTIIAGGLGVAFLGYCVYFDHKRRSHPDFKKRVIESKYFKMQHFSNFKLKNNLSF